MVRTEATPLPGVGPVRIHSESALQDGARRLRFSMLRGLLRRRG